MPLELYRPTVVREIMTEYGLRAKKNFGQNFLTDRNILVKIGAAANLEPKDTVIEVGPGLGTLGAFFADKVEKWVAVEIDQDLAPALQRVKEESPNFKVVFGDFLKLPLDDLTGGESYKVVANLPYYITTPIIQKVILSTTLWESMVVMVQWEVAQRFVASPGTKDYGSISLLIQYYGKPEIAVRVSPNSFYPAPDVDSAVLTITRRQEPPVRVASEELLFLVIRSAFHQRRKTIANSLLKAPYLNFSKEQIAAALLEARISPSSRGEVLNLEEFAQLTEAFSRLYKMRRSSIMDM